MNGSGIDAAARALLGDFTADDSTGVDPVIQKALSTGALQIAQLAIAESDGGELTFYKRTDSGGEMSSIHKSTCQAVGGHTPECVEYTVPTATCKGLLAKYGVPLFLKVDIEGADELCIKSLRSLPGKNFPSYVSTENPGLIESLEELGYKKFKVGRQILLSSIPAHTLAA